VPINWSNRNLNPMEEVMTINNSSEAAKAVVRRNTEEVQGGGNFDVFDELFADDFLDHTPQPIPKAFGAWLEVGDERFDSSEIQRLYEAADYPLSKPE
jgi:hypothetical protein